jgi:hypothetical protein
MNPSWEWTERDILGLIATRVTENLNLEYKRCNALQRSDKNTIEISKDVSSFANSSGGTIVYGVIEDKYVPTGIDIGYNPRDDITKEWLENVITSNIKPRIDGLRINLVELTSTHPGYVLYVVHIPQTKRPHMAKDHRFYKRFNFKAEPMEEYEIWDVARRKEGPDLSLSFQILKAESILMPHGEYTDIGSDRRVSIYMPINNDSEEPAFHIDIRIFVDVRLEVWNNAGLTGGGTQLNGSMPMRVLYTQWSVPYQLPVWNGSDSRVGPIIVRHPLIADNYLLAWQLRSPNMKLKEGIAHLRCNGTGIAIDVPEISSLA